MIRRKATSIGLGINGFVLAWNIRTDASGNQTTVMILEATATGIVAEYPANDIKFLDGSPDVIPEVP